MLRNLFLVMVVAAVGCKRQAQVDYSDWRQDPQVVCRLPAQFNQSSASQPIQLEQLKATEGDVMLFEGELARDENSTSAVLRVEFGKPDGERFIFYCSAGAVVSFAKGDRERFEIYIKAPRRGRYEGRVLVNNQLGAKLELQVSAKRGSSTSSFRAPRGRR